MIDNATTCAWCHAPWEADQHGYGVCVPTGDQRREAAIQTQMERVANLRGYSGQLRAALRDAYDNAPNGTVVHSILGNALAIPAPENG